MTELDRRAVLKAACAGCAGLALAACGGGGSADADDPAAQEPAAPAGSSAAAAPGGPIVQLADVKVGTSVSARSEETGRLVLTRVDETTVVAFSSACTHTGCTVEPDGERFACPCHGSTFDAKTGERLGGPAPSGLRNVPVVVRGGGVFPA